MIDNALMYSDAQDLTADADSTSHVDHGVARDLGSGERLFLLVRFGTVVSNATLKISLSGDDDDGGTGALTILDSPVITPVSNSFIALPIRSHTPKRYTKVVYDLTGGTSPHIPVTATLVPEVQLRAFSRVY